MQDKIKYGFYYYISKKATFKDKMMIAFTLSFLEKRKMKLKHEHVAYINDLPILMNMN
jgi:predicted phosphatase